jgi:hypothetical protein
MGDRGGTVLSPILPQRALLELAVTLVFGGRETGVERSDKFPHRASEEGQVVIKTMRGGD